MEKDLSIYDWKKLAVSLGLENEEKEKRINELESAMQEYVDECELEGKYKVKFEDILKENK